MSKSYTIVKREYTKNVWDSIEPLEIDIFKWVNNNYRPRTYAKLFYNDNAICVQFTVYEKQIVARYNNMHDPVYLDSCVEIFFRPDRDMRYINFEINAIGAVLLGVGKNRYDRKKIDEDISAFEIKNTVDNPKTYNNDKWQVEFKIPFWFFEKYFDSFQKSEPLWANFYKCGEETTYEHYGMWSDIEFGEDFHQSKYFGKLHLEPRSKMSK